MTRKEFFEIARKGDFEGMIVDKDNFEYMIEFLEECRRENKELQETNKQLAKELDEAYDEISRINMENY